MLMALDCYKDLGFVLHYHLPVRAATLRTLEDSGDAAQCLCRHNVMERY